MLTLKPVYKVIAASTIGLSVLSTASAVHAANLVPQQEGEIKLTNLACLSNTDPKCIDTSSGTNGYTVTSLTYDPQFSESRLFADKRGTANDYSAFGIQFKADDEGTNPSAFQEYWLRPVAYTAPVTTKSSPKSNTVTQKNVDAPAGAKVGIQTTPGTPTESTITNSKGEKVTTTITIDKTINTKQTKVNGVTKLVQDISTKTTTQTTTVTTKPVENGRLEVGKFKFDFKNALSGLQFSFFDVEDSKYTGILSYTNSQGKTFSINELLNAGKDGNRQLLTIKDVKSFVVQLGNPGTNYGYKNSNFKTGDGANLQLQSVPEPGAVGGLATLAVFGLMSRRQRKNKAA